MSKSIQKRRVLITGGTGSVGQALIEKFAANGDIVTFQYRGKKDRADEIARSFNASAIQLDFEKDTTLPRADFDILVNNSAINIADPVTHEVPLKDWNSTILVNVTAPFCLAQQCLPHMKKRKWGRIINISSIYGLRAVWGRCPYTVSKHALSGLTKTIAKEYAHFGITCNEICPGPIDSEMMDRIAKESGKKEGQTAKQYLSDVCEEIPAGRLAKPTEIADLAVFIASSKAGYLTGVSIPLDGGMIA